MLNSNTNLDHKQIICDTFWKIQIQENYNSLSYLPVPTTSCHIKLFKYEPKSRTEKLIRYIMP